MHTRCLIKTSWFLLVHRRRIIQVLKLQNRYISAIRIESAFGSFISLDWLTETLMCDSTLLPGITSCPFHDPVLHREPRTLVQNQPDERQHVLLSASTVVAFADSLPRPTPRQQRAIEEVENHCTIVMEVHATSTRREQN